MTCLAWHVAGWCKSWVVNWSTLSDSREFKVLCSNSNTFLYQNLVRNTNDLCQRINKEGNNWNLSQKPAPQGTLHVCSVDSDRSLSLRYLPPPLTTGRSGKEDLGSVKTWAYLRLVLGEKLSQYFCQPALSFKLLIENKEKKTSKNETNKQDRKLCNY